MAREFSCPPYFQSNCSTVSLRKRCNSFLAVPPPSGSPCLYLAYPVRCHCFLGARFVMLSSVTPNVNIRPQLKFRSRFQTSHATTCSKPQSMTRLAIGFPQFGIEHARISAASEQQLPEPSAVWCRLGLRCPWKQTASGSRHPFEYSGPSTCQTRL